MESYATNLLVICGHISFGMDFFTIFLGTPCPSATWLSSAQVGSLK
jgi:hypothetical protein